MDLFTLFLSFPLRMKNISDKICRVNKKFHFQYWTAVQRTAPQGLPRTPATCFAATTPGLNFRILNSVF